MDFTTKIRLLIRLFFNRLSVYSFHKRQIKESLARRKGKCKRCGYCCRYLGGFELKCIFLTGNNLCSLHRLKRYLPILRQMCYYAPVIKEYRYNPECGYYW